MSRIAIITSGYFPVPDSKGGAVEHLVTLLLEGAERSDSEISFEVFSCWDKEALLRANEFRNTNFTFIQTPSIVKLVDKSVYRFARFVLRKEKAFSFRYVFQRLNYIGRIAKYLESEQYDAVLVENHPLLLFPFKNKSLAKKYQGRVLFHMHNELNGRFGCASQLATVDLVITISDYLCQRYAETIPTFDARRFRVLRNCLEIEKYGAEAAIRDGKKLRSQLQLSKDDKVVLFAGRLSPEKGVRELLLSFAAVKERIPEAKIVIVGATFYTSGATSPYEEEVKSIAMRYGDSVRFTGYIEHDAMPAVYSMADVCAAPSLCDEGACMTALEAVASGKPVVATKSGGIPEYLDNSYAVLLDRDGNLVEKMSEALIVLLSNEEIRRQMAHASLEARVCYSSDKYFDNFKNIVNSSIAIDEARNKETR